MLINRSRSVVAGTCTKSAAASLTKVSGPGLYNIVLVATMAAFRFYVALGLSGMYLVAFIFT